MRNSPSSAHCLFVNQTDANMLATPSRALFGHPPLLSTPLAHQFHPVCRRFNFGSHQHCNGEPVASFSSLTSNFFFRGQTCILPPLLPLRHYIPGCSQCHALATPRHQHSMPSHQCHIDFKPSTSRTQHQHFNKSSTQAFRLQDSLNNQSTHAS